MLIEHLRDQGVPLEVAMELVERKLKNPKLTGISIQGKWISFDVSRPSKFDAMVESGIPPGTSGTDRAFLQSTDNGRQFANNPEAGDFYVKEAAKHGKRVGRGEVYKTSLARFPGDPRAFVSDLGEAKKVIELRQKEEAIKAQKDNPDIDVSDRIVNRETALALAGQTVTGREYKDMREKVKDKLRPPWKKKK